MADDSDPRDPSQSGFAFGEAGQTIGSYRLVGLLGEGGVGVVYEAQHLRLSRRAAIKVLRPEYSKNPDMVRRFFNEAESVNLVQHPGIVTIFEFGQLEAAGGGAAFIVMEMLEGETLRQRLRRGRLGAGAARIVRQMASALAAAHARGIVHRDLKPENVMIVRDPDMPGGERTKILDFGIAKVAAAQAAQQSGDLFRTQAGQMMGTPSYMSPEQLRDTGGVDAKADVYSLGVMFFEMLAGRLPFSAASLAEIVGMHLFNPPPSLQELDPTLPAPLCQLVASMLAKDPAQRPDMAAVRDALERFEGAGVSQLTAPGRDQAAPSQASGPAGAAPSQVSGTAARGAATAQTSSVSQVKGQAAGPPGAAGSPGSPGSRSRLVYGVGGLLGAAAIAGGALGYRALHRPAPAPAPIVQPQPPVAERPRPAPVDLAALRERSLAVLREGLRAPDPGMRGRAASIVGASLDGQSAALLVPLLEDADPSVQAQTATSLRLLGSRQAVPALREILKQRSTAEEVRLEVAGALAQLGEPSGERLLTKALRSKDEALRGRAALLLGERGDRAARAELVSGGAIDEERAAALGRLFRVGDRAAGEELERAMKAEGAATDLQLRAAAELARGDDASARAFLEKIAAGEGPQSLRAARLLAALDDPSFYDRFIRCFPSEACPLPDRITSAEGLGAYGRKDAAPVLSEALPEDGRRPLRLRLSAAGGVLQIAARDPDIAGAVALRAVEDDLRDSERPRRADAADALGDAEPKVALPLLKGAIKDEAEEVRRSAAQALGRTRAREAVPVLGEALEDRAAPVRKEAMDSLGRVGEHLRQRGEPVADVVQTVTAHAGHGDKSERLAGVAALVRLGATSLDGQADRKDELQKQLREALRSGDAEIRRQAVEAWSADAHSDPEVLVGALGDRAEAVRFAAAVGLAERGRREGVPVLVQALGKPTASAVTARGLLQRLGLATPGAIVLGDGPPAERAAMVSAATRLPAGEALTLLRQAAQDLAARVRLRVLAVLAELPDLARSKGGRRLLAGLLQDRDAAVRSRAGLLVARFGLRPGEEPAPAKETPAEPAPALPAQQDLAPPAPDLAAPADLAATEAHARGQLVIEAEPEVRFQLDRRPQQTGQPGAAKPISISPGKHKLSWAGGALEVEVRPGETATAKVTLTQGEQLLLDSIEALRAGDLDRAQQLLSRAQGLLRGGSKAQLFALSYQQGRLFESQGRWVDAMGAYERLAKKAPGAGERAQLDEAVARVATHLGRIKVGKVVDGKCQTTELWLPPGTHEIDVGAGSKEVRVRAGETLTVQACE